MSHSVPQSPAFPSFHDPPHTYGLPTKKKN